MENNDKLCECSRCAGDCCYKTRISPSINNYFCMGCGYQTTSLMKKDSDFFLQQMEILPNLYKELSGEDQNGLIWIPTFINQIGLGMVFMSGNSAENAKWAAVKAVKVTEENKEDHKLKNGTYPEYYMDMKNMKLFEEKDFMDALSFIGVLPQ